MVSFKNFVLCKPPIRRVWSDFMRLELDEAKREAEVWAVVMVLVLSD
jgi:hypothetical protein